VRAQEICRGLKYDLLVGAEGASLFPTREKADAVAAGAMVVEVEVVAVGLPKIPDPKIVPVMLVVGALAVKVLLFPVAAGAVVPPGFGAKPKSPLPTLGVAAIKKVSTFLLTREVRIKGIPVVLVLLASAGFGGKLKKPLGVLDVPVIDYGSILDLVQMGKRQAT